MDSCGGGGQRQGGGVEGCWGMGEGWGRGHGEGWGMPGQGNGVGCQACGGAQGREGRRQGRRQGRLGGIGHQTVGRGGRLGPQEADGGMGTPARRQELSYAPTSGMEQGRHERSSPWAWISSGRLARWGLWVAGDHCDTPHGGSGPVPRAGDPWGLWTSRWVWVAEGAGPRALEGCRGSGGRGVEG